MSARDPIPRELAYAGVKAKNPPEVIPSKRDPLPSDFQYTLGTFWINTVSKKSFQLVANPGVWASSSEAVGGLLNTLSANTGIQAQPAAGNIAITGGTNITTNGIANGITVSTVANPTFTTVTGTTVIATNGGFYTATGEIEAAVGNIRAGLSLIAGNGVDVHEGDVLVTDGNYATGAAGRGFSAGGANSFLSFAGSGSFIRMKGGTALDFIGQATLVAGTVTIANTNILAGDRILIQRQSINGSTILGELVYTISSGVSFTIESRILGTPASIQNVDTSIVSYFIVRQSL